MGAFSQGFLDGLQADGFILKNRSPSCAPKDARIYGPKGNLLGRKKAFSPERSAGAPPSTPWRRRANEQNSSSGPRSSAGPSPWPGSGIRQTSRISEPSRPAGGPSLGPTRGLRAPSALSRGHGPVPGGIPPGRTSSPGALSSRPLLAPSVKEEVAFGAEPLEAQIRYQLQQPLRYEGGRSSRAWSSGTRALKTSGRGAVFPRRSIVSWSRLTEAKGSWAKRQRRGMGMERKGFLTPRAF